MNNLIYEGNVLLRINGSSTSESVKTIGGTFEYSKGMVYADTDLNGTNPVEYIADNHNTYKYIRYEEFLPTNITHPSNQSVNVGETATFTVTATGTLPFSYQWQVKADDASGWVDITGATDASYTTETASPTMDGYKYRCRVTNASGTVTSNEAELSVTDPDAAVVDDAKTSAENAVYSNMTQEDVSIEEDIIDALLITAQNAVNNESVNVTINKISYQQPVAGTSADSDGTDGSYTFTVTVAKGYQSGTTEEITITIMATAFTGITDIYAVATAKNAVVGGTVAVAYGADQTAKTAAVQSYVNNLLTGDAEGVTAVVTHSSGNIYIVTLGKGSIEDSKYITMTINEDENPDIAKVNTAKSLIEGASYTMVQTAANTVDSVKEELVRQIENLSGMSATGVVVTATNITVSDFVAATAGTSANSAGTNGSFSFIVSLSKGAVNNTTISKTGTITATAYTGTPTNPTEPIGPSRPPAQPPVDVPTPSPTPQNNSGISVVIPKKDGKENIDITSVTTEEKDDQITVTIKADDIKSELEKEDEQGVQLDLIVPEQDDNSERKEINIILKSDVIQKAKENNKNIEVGVKDTDEKILYSWTFDKTELANSDKDINDVNLSLKVDKAPEDAPFADEQKDDKDNGDSVALVIDFAHEGVLPAQASVRIYVGNQEGVAPGAKVYLYHYNEQTGKLETIPFGYQAVVDEDGYITINILHCSDYVVYTKEADSKQYVSLRNQIKVTPTRMNLSLSEGKDGGKIEVKLPVTREWVKSLNEPTSQSAMGGVTVSFTSGNNKIATVDSEGNITAKAPGTVVIKATITLYSKKTKTVEIVVKVKA